MSRDSAALIFHLRRLHFTKQGLEQTLTYRGLSYKATISYLQIGEIMLMLCDEIFIVMSDFIYLFFAIHAMTIILPIIKEHNLIHFFIELSVNQESSTSETDISSSSTSPPHSDPGCC